MKREFYTDYIAKDFTKYVETRSDEEMKEFQEYCKFYNGLGCLTMSRFELKPGASTPI